MAEGIAMEIKVNSWIIESRIKYCGATSCRFNEFPDRMSCKLKAVEIGGNAECREFERKVKNGN